MIRLQSVISLSIVLAATSISSRANSAAVGYAGALYGVDGTLVQNGFIVAGTFAPGFNAQNYACFYGDSACNLYAGHYSQAAADGNFRPIGTGTLTNSGGGFFNFAVTTEAAGTPVWLFGFATSNPDTSIAAVLTTSSDASFHVPAGEGITLAEASLANQFVFGSMYGRSLRVGHLPIPEPTCAVLLLPAIAASVTTQAALVLGFVVYALRK